MLKQQVSMGETRQSLQLKNLTQVGLFLWRFSVNYKNKPKVSKIKTMSANWNMGKEKLVNGAQSYVRWRRGRKQKTCLRLLECQLFTWISINVRRVLSRAIIER